MFSYNLSHVRNDYFQIHISCSQLSTQSEDGISDGCQQLYFGILEASPTQRFPNWVRSVFLSELVLPLEMFVLISNSAVFVPPYRDTWSCPHLVASICFLLPLSRPPTCSHSMTCHHYSLILFQSSSSSPSTGASSVQVLILFYLSGFISFEVVFWTTTSPPYNSQSCFFKWKISCITPQTKSHC